MDENASSRNDGLFAGGSMGGLGDSCGGFRRYRKTESSGGLRVAVGKSLTKVPSLGELPDIPSTCKLRFRPAVHAARYAAPEIVSQLTNDIIQTYQLCNPNFKHSEILNPRRYLTSPHDGVSNGGFDNANSDLILSVNFSLINEKYQRRYIVKEMLGHGTFGQVAKCWVPDKNEFVAVKVIKNQPAYFNQAKHEVTILRTLNQNFDPENKHHIVRMLEFFVFRFHLCICFEMLGPNLYDLLQLNNLKGLRLNLVQMFSKQILHALVVMKNAGIVHCDMKPENILVWTSAKPKGVKVIDFGSACKEGHTVYSYIQSRHYRSPEVLLGYPYNTAIDMWSFGCIVAELFLGLPLFPGLSEYDVLRRMIEVLGGQPPDIMLRHAKKTTKFFKHVGGIHRLDDNQVFHENDCAYRLFTEAEYEARERLKPAIGKWYFNHVKLKDIIVGHPYKSNLPEEEKSKEEVIRLALIDFVKGLVEFDPEKRWTPLQASGHPFVTGEPFTEPYCPPPIAFNTPVVPNIRMDNGPDRGHWIASGLSPQAIHMSRSVQHGSPRFHMMPLSHGTGYGSWGSYGSYNDSQHLTGSYGDNSKDQECSSVGLSGPSIPMHIVGSTLGASTDATGVASHSHGSVFGMSPTGTFRQLPLGVSPSQFTSPRSQIQVSNVSPGKHDPTSPANDSSYCSSLGKAVAASQYHKRSLGHPGTMSMQHSQGASQHWRTHQLDVSHSEQIPLGFFGSPRSTHAAHSNWQQERGAKKALSGFPLLNNQFPRSAHAAQSSWQQERGATEALSGFPLLNNQSVRSLQQGNRNDALHASGSSSSHPEGLVSPLDPGDWDPNYSDDLLLQEDNVNISNLACEIINMQLASSVDPTVLNIQSSRHKQGTRTISNSVPSDTRTDGQASRYLHSQSSQSDTHSGHNLPLHSAQQQMSHLSQSSPSRFAQPPAYHFVQMQSILVNDGIDPRPNIRPINYIYSSEEPSPPAYGAFGSSPVWGQQAGYPIATTSPAYRSRNNYWRIS